MASIWTYIEPTVAIISACLPFFSKFFKEKVSKISHKARTIGHRTTVRGGSGNDRAITKRTTTTVTDESNGSAPNHHELVGYSVRVGGATSDGKMRLGSESSQSLV